MLNILRSSADIGIIKEELDEFTVQFNKILDYFDILDQSRARADMFRNDSMC